MRTSLILVGCLAQGFSQICNSRDLVNGGGPFVPAFYHGQAMATLPDGTELVTCTKNTSDPAGRNNYGCESAPFDPQPMAIVYLILLLWTFLGVGIISDVFMGAIETITSKSKLVEFEDDSTGKIMQVEIFAWNATVANLSLMALGSSAPEIMLAVIEILLDNFFSGELGPSTIVGSAAFNLLGILAVCMIAIPKRNGTSETGFRKIDELGVFGVTAVSSVFAYVWIIIILQWSSPEVVTILEAAITLLFFPLLMMIAFVVDKGYCCNRAPTPDEENDKLLGIKEDAGNVIRFQNIREADELLKGTNYKPKHMTPEQLADVIMAKKMEGKKVSRAQRRIEATRGMTGGKHVLPKSHDLEAPKEDAYVDGSLFTPRQPAYEYHVGFETTKYSILESEGNIEVSVKREKDSKGEISIDYETKEGTATAEDDYKSVNGTLVFKEGETEQTISVEIIKDDVKEDDETFFVELSNLKVLSKPGESSNFCIPLALKSAEVTIIDDDSVGKIHFAKTNSIELLDSKGEFDTARGTADTEPDDINTLDPKPALLSIKGKKNKVVPMNEPASPPATSVPPGKLPALSRSSGTKMRKTKTSTKIEASGTLYSGKLLTGGNMCQYSVPESDGKVLVKVLREGGSAGRAVVKYSTKDGTAVAPADYIAVEDGELVFEQGEVEKTLMIEIIDDEEFEKDEYFHIRLTSCEGAELGEIATCVVTIENDDDMKSLGVKVAHLMRINLDKYRIGTSSWKQQFTDAVEWPDGNACDKFLHCVSVFWKVLFAICPPTAFCGGWVCFVVAIFLIGGTTALIGDLANLLGCSIGLKKSVTAITFVALGTSLPDTFASMAAAVQDTNADSSIGNVTGSNSVNVFLGLGLPWTLAALVWWGEGATEEWKARVSPAVVTGYPNGAFYVPAGELSFSVTVFSCCAVACIGTLLARRALLGYELGGKYTLPASILFGMLWILYILLSSFKAYEII